MVALVTAPPAVAALPTILWHRALHGQSLRISRLDVESRVLGGLQTKLLRKDFFEEFCREFAKEMNRLRMEQRTGLNMAKRELSRVETRRKKLRDLMLDDVSTSEGKEEMLGLTARRDELSGRLACPTVAHAGICKREGRLVAGGI